VDGGYVFNLEVDGLHTYVANGIVVHNCHHCVSQPEPNKWGTATARFVNARGLGVTATPLRADGKGLGRQADGPFDDMIVGPTMRELIEMGFLTDYRIIAKPSDIQLSDDWVTATGDYSRDKLSKARAVSHITGDVVKHYQQFASGKRGVTFDVDVSSATETAAAFRAAGVPAEVVSAKTPDEVRRAILRRFRSGEILQLVNVDLFGEGFDLPAIEVVSMARPTQSYGLFVQQFGRALRIMEGKDRAVIIDHVGNVARHGLPDAYREWSLDRRERRSKSGASDVVPTRTCTEPLCSSVFERHLKACPFCGAEVVISDRSHPSYVDGVLEELDPSVLARMRGDAEKVFRPALMPVNVSWEARGAILKHHDRAKTAQQSLRPVMDLWAGWQAHQGRDQRETEARFYHRYGLDVMSAQALKAREAEELRARIETDLGRFGVVRQ
jgi:DNA repair protein RadD